MSDKTTAVQKIVINPISSLLTATAYYRFSKAAESLHNRVHGGKIRFLFVFPGKEYSKVLATIFADS